MIKMKTLMEILGLKHDHKIIHKGEEILIEEAIKGHGIETEDHALNRTPQINREFYQNKDIHFMHEVDEDLVKSIEHLKNNEDIKLTKSLTDLIKIHLQPFENRTIEIKKEGIAGREIIRVFKDYKINKAVVGYKHWVFPMKDGMWEKHSPEEGERIVFYAFPRTRGAKALEEIGNLLGNLVATKRKQYTKYASHEYKINDSRGLHARPAAELVKIASRYEGDVWLRTDSNEANGKSIMQALILKATADKELTVLYKPKEQSEQFYAEVESINYEDGRLFTRLK